MLKNYGLHLFCILLLSQRAHGQVALKVFKNYQSCLYGIVDTLSGDTLFTPQFTESEAREGYLLVRKNEAAGAILLRTGQQVLPCRYQEIISLQPGEANEEEKRLFSPWFFFKQNDLWGLLHLRKGVVQLPRALWMSKKPGSAQVAGLWHDSTAFCGDTTGYIQFFKGCTGIDHARLEHFVMLKKDGKWSLANTKGQLLFNFEFDWFMPLDHGHVHFKKEATEGFIDRNGRLFLETEKLQGPKKYSETRYRGTSLCQVPGGSWGYLNVAERLTWLLEPQYEYIVENSNTLYSYRMGTYDYVNKQTGQVIFSGASQLRQKSVSPRKQGSFKKTYVLQKGSLYQVNERNYRIRFLAKAQAFELVEGRKLFVQIEGLWQVWEADSFRALDTAVLGF